MGVYVKRLVIRNFVDVLIQQQSVSVSFAGRSVNFEDYKLQETN